MRLFNKPARLFVLDASLCLFKYLRDSICYGVIEAAMKRWWCGQADWVRNGSEGMAKGLRVLEFYLAHLFLLLYTHCIHIHRMISLSASCALGSPLTSQGNCGEKTFQFRHVEQTLMSLARGKARRGSHTFLITTVITFIIIIIRVQSGHTQHRYPIYTIFS